MKNTEEIMFKLSAHKQRLTDKYGLSLLAIFGSYSRSEHTKESDIDIIVDFSKPIGIEFIDLAEELENILKTKIDLVSLKGIKSEYYNIIEKDLKYV